MGFFAEFSAWLDQILNGYIASNTTQLASAIAPAVLAFATLYVMLWGYLLVSGRVQQPLIEGIRRLCVLAVLLGSSLQLWLYNAVIVDTFFNGPSQLAGGIVGSPDSVSVVDQIIFTGGDAGNLLLEKGSIFNGDFAYYIAGAAVDTVVGMTAIYAMFLLALSKIALSVLLALGPLFIALLFFETTKRFFEAWLAQLANYAFIAILTALVCALMLNFVTIAARQAVSAAGDIQIAHGIRVCLAAGLTLLVMRQVMPMASGLASGLALNTYGALSAIAKWSVGRMAGSVGQTSRAVSTAVAANRTRAAVERALAERQLRPRRE